MTLFLSTEIVLLLAFAVFRYALVGYKTIGLIFLALAVLLAFYKLFSAYEKVNEKTVKILRTALTLLLCAGFALFVIIEIPIIGSAHTDKNPEAPYLIVLGAGVNGTVPSLSLFERLEAAKEYMYEYPSAVAVVSGGQGEGENITEAECMRRWLEKNGIASERILTEYRASSTYENIKYSLQVISGNGGNPNGRVAIVSSEYHLFRAKSYARKLGAEALGVAAHTSYPVMRINYFIREAFGVAAMWTM